MYYFRNAHVIEWMNHRSVAADLAITSGVLLFCASDLAERIVHLVLELPSDEYVLHALAQRVLQGRLLRVLVGGLFLGATIFVAPSLLELVRIGATFEHCSRFIAASVWATPAVILVDTRVLDFLLSLLSARLAFLREQADERRAHSRDG